METAGGGQLLAVSGCCDCSGFFRVVQRPAWLVPAVPLNLSIRPPQSSSALCHDMIRLQSIKGPFLGLVVTATIAIVVLTGWVYWDFRRQSETVGSLIKALDNENQAARKEARDGLVHIGHPAVPALIGALKHEQQWVRWEVAEALGKIGPDAKDAVPALIDVFLHDKMNTPRRAAAEGLMGIGPSAKAAVPALIEKLDDPAVGFEVRQALKKIDPETGARVSGE